MTRTHKCKVEYLIKFISKGEKSDHHLFDLEVLKKPKTDIVAFSDSVNMVETLSTEVFSLEVTFLSCRHAKNRPKLEC